MADEKCSPFYEDADGNRSSVNVSAVLQLLTGSGGRLANSLSSTSQWNSTSKQEITMVLLWMYFSYGPRLKRGHTRGCVLVYKACH